MADWRARRDVHLVRLDGDVVSRLRVGLAAGRKERRARGGDAVDVARHRQRAALAGDVGWAAHDRAAEDRVQAVLVGEDLDAVERVRVAPDRGVAAVDEGRHDLVRAHVRCIRDDLRDGLLNRQRPGRKRGIRARVDGAPGAVRDGGDPVVGIAAQLPHRPDAPRHRARPRRVLVERVVLALVGHVRARRELLVGVDQPDGVPARAGDRAPAEQARIARGERRGNGRPAHVEAERECSTSRRPSTSPRARAHRASRAGRSSRGARSGPRRPGSSGRSQTR